jgi:hypothetical protein
VDAENDTQKGQTIISKTERVADDKLQGITQQIIPVETNCENYQVCALPLSNLPVSDAFFDSGRTQKILSQIKQIVEMEAPISQTLLSKRILAAWGITRLGVRLNDFLNRLYRRLELKQSKQNGTVFYWRQDQEPDLYNQYRIPKNDSQKRNAEDLPKEEIAAGIHEILTHQISLPPDDLVRETARLFGYARIGANVEQAMKLGIDYALQKGIITENNDRIILT